MVYFIQSGDAGPIKIGYVKGSPLQRLFGMQRENWQTVELLALLEGGLSEEKALHREFADDRIRGEWFEPSSSLLAYIEEHGMSYNERYERLAAVA